MTLVLVVTVFCLPFLGACLAFILGRRGAFDWVRNLSLLTVGGVVAALVGVAVQLAEKGVIRDQLGGWGAPLGIDYRVDGLSVLFLLFTAGVAAAVLVYAGPYFRRQRGGTWFWPLALSLWGALQALYLANDLFNFYVCLELMTLGAVASVTLSGTPNALDAALDYLFAALAGSMFYLLGVALVYADANTLDLTQLAATGVSKPTVAMALALMTGGLLLKTALFPLHFWLPSAHGFAPAPVSAMLSALVIKGSFFILVRLWAFPDGEVFGAPAAAPILTALGSAAVVWGSVQAFVQDKLKLIVAYSTIAQIGYLFLALSLVAGGTGTSPLSGQGEAWLSLAYFAISHGVAKCAWFLAVGSWTSLTGAQTLADVRGLASRMPFVTLAWGLAGVSLIGLPPSGGFIAKWHLLTAALKGGQWWVAPVVLLGTLLASVYTFRVLWHSFESDDEANGVSPKALELGSRDWLLGGVPLALAIVAIALGFFAKGAFQLLEVGVSVAAAGGGP